MKLQGRLLPRAELDSDKSNTNSWDIMHIVQSLDALKPTRRQKFSFAHFKK